MALALLPFHGVARALGYFPFGFIGVAVLLACWGGEVLYRRSSLGTGSSVNWKIRAVGPHFYFLHIEGMPHGAFRPGQWVYLSCPSLTLMERHPFTIVAVEREHPHQFVVLNNAAGELVEQQQPQGRNDTLVFLIQVCEARPNSWTRSLLGHWQELSDMRAAVSYFNVEAALPVHLPTSLHLDGPFSGALDAILRKQELPPLVFLAFGSGVTASLGILKGLTEQPNRVVPWSAFVFSTREYDMLVEVVSLFRELESLPQGGVMLHYTGEFWLYYYYYYFFH